MYQKALAKRKAVARINSDFMRYLLAKNRVTKDELKDFFTSKLQTNENMV